MYAFAIAASSGNRVERNFHMIGPAPRAAFVASDGNALPSGLDN